ncbi:MAG TPA: hypothetical protein VGO43_02585 [Pyrinomonadaceae bacterium]|nr:hypothetical protein [Pyrinomonadaceae bacterium]
MRTLVPAETLVYLETNDLAAALQPVVGSKAFPDADLVAFKGVQVAVVVTAFEASEQKVSDEQSAAEIKPKVVAVADTHAWHFQAVKFAEQRLGAFVAKVYGSEPTLEEPERNGGRDMTWTAKDGRKAYAFVTGGVIYFGNDHDLIDKCLAVRKGDLASLAQAGKVQQTPADALASGYVSTDGVAQVADILGLQISSAASDDAQVRSALASSLPQIIREMVSEAAWVTRAKGSSVEETFQFVMPGNLADAIQGSEPADLEARLCNAMIALLPREQIDSSTRVGVASALAARIAGTEDAQVRVLPNGIERKVASGSGLLGWIAAQFGDL